ncbi:hypothetical protein HYH02_013631 [Chlamydomonas schloesseri]|uniref:Ubiquitin thioesterase OTU n=1 Tax=Chlamydomonas schloesseri TaxID=2026947 RepID=A0A835SP79_9CHLO|nr:hypothetical protein HYH02_013631 [Chlamydomonas schloesseri]|eukprot:KAG2430792.1 hypothetical protein HYH02_013631 [Chlamydomonas schloesseri]
MLVSRRALTVPQGLRRGVAAPVRGALPTPAAIPPPYIISTRHYGEGSAGGLLAAPTFANAIGSASRRFQPYHQPLFLTRTSATSSSSSSSGGGAGASKELRFAVHRISGDGACMFRAIVQGAQYATRGKAMPAESEGTAAHNLRLAVVAELRKRREEIEPFLPGIATDFDEYCKTMSHPMAWGGEPEMLMAMHVLGRPITVYHLTDRGLEPIVTYGEQLLDGGAAPIHLLWSGAHYDLLVPAEAAAAAAAAAEKGE